MKYLILLIIPFLLLSCGPTRKVVKKDYPKPFEFEFIDTLPGTQKELYVKAHEWICRTYGSAKTVIDMKDKEAGRLIGKAMMTYVDKNGPVRYKDEVRYIIAIYVKEGRYRCLISDFFHEKGENSGSPRSYGYLKKEKFEYRIVESNKMQEDMHYYAVKNRVMEESLALLAYLKLWMHTPEKDF